MIAARERFRRGRVSRAITVVCLALMFAVVAVRYPKALSQLGDSASSNSSLSFEDREIAGGNSIIVDQRAAYEARALIPVKDSYRVVVGPSLHHKTELTEGFVTSWLTYFLMPRRPAEDARWVICYGCDLATLGPSSEARWQDDDGISIRRPP
jgi:hypothetical protein